MEFEGDMLDSLTYKTTQDGLELGWFGEQAGKADGHNNLSGKSSLPQRRLIPDVGQEFVGEIQSEIEKIVADGVADEMSFEPSDFEGVSTRSELYATLDDYFPDFSRAEIRSVIARSPDLARLLDEMGLLELL